MNGTYKVFKFVTQIFQEFVYINVQSRSRGPEFIL